MARTAVLASLAAVALGQQGPGAGPWETARPEDFGLSTEKIKAAGEEIRSKASGRQCYLIVKKGKIVHEEYYNGGPTTRNTAYSTTKSLCSSLFGISVHQGWGNVNHNVERYSRDHLKCNPKAAMKNVLTMTGQSPDLSRPEFKYDALGTDCYDTIQGYILKQNPEGLSTEEWMRKHFWNKVGFEHSEWRAKIWLQCGTSAEFTCRDLARHAQLWLNDGYWPGVGQMIDPMYIKNGTQWVYPNQGEPYGYGLRLRPNDPVDDKVAFFSGVYLQCAFFSKKHDAIVVSMGDDFWSSCKTEVWEDARYAIVSEGANASATKK